MQNMDEFRKRAHQAIEWIAGYYQHIEEYPVKSQVRPGAIYDELPEGLPEKGEEIDRMIRDFDDLLLKGITHWQSPRFFAYFPANTSLPSLIAEMMTAAIGAQGMKWETSPAVAELEQKVMEWLRDAIGLPGVFEGVIQDSASTSSLVAILTARERATGYDVNEEGLMHQGRFRVYASSEAHSSIERAVKVAGLGKKNLVRIPVDEAFRMKPGKLEEVIRKDREAGYRPLCVVATLGTTGSTAVDPLKEVGEISRRYNIWLHVDAAYAGSALILPEYRWMIEGIDAVDSFVFNPHKWLFTNFDCSAYFVRDAKALTNTFQLVPEYLKTRSDDYVNNYSDWTIPLGRRFRALKLWFVLRYYGLQGLQQKLQHHLELAKDFRQKVAGHPDFEILAPTTMNVVCFRMRPTGVQSEEKLNELNEELLHAVNATGKIYITHTKLGGIYTLRMVIAQTHVEGRHVEEAWQVLQGKARTILSTISGSRT